MSRVDETMEKVLDAIKDRVGFHSADSEERIVRLANAYHLLAHAKAVLEPRRSYGIALDGDAVRL